MSKIELLILHSSYTKANMDVTPAMIKSWHTDPKPSGRGWRQVGYSKLIRLNGEVNVLVEVDDNQILEAHEITNGVFGINRKAVHFCYAGGMGVDGKAEDTRTQEQHIMLVSEVKDFIAKHPQIKVGGHNQFSSKECPCFDVPEWCELVGIPEENIYRN
jgi:N-acetylmuramoyl-L-alanine amidase